MIGTFLYLTACSIKNRLLRRLRRLREPRYWVGLLVGLLYLYWFIVRNQLRASPRGPHLESVLSWLGPAAAAGGSVALWIAALVMWFFPSSEPPVKFSGAEIQFFYTAPVSRRALLTYKLLRAQVGVLFGVVIASIFTGAASAAASGRWSLLLGGWVLFASMFLHVIGIRFTKASLQAPSAAVRWRAWAAAGAMAAISVVILGTLAWHARGVWALAPGQQVRGWVELATTGLAGMALWPFRALVAPLFATTPRAFVQAGFGALVVLVVNYWWVLQSQALVDEAAVAAERRQARGASHLPAPVARRAPFELGLRGRPETAILWKNLILIGRYASLRVLFRVLLPVIALAIALGATRRAGIVAPMALLVAIYLILLGPYMVRNDLRHDLPRLQLLKTWPMAGRTLLVGELLAPTAVLSVMVWFLLAVALALSNGLSYAPASFADRVTMAGVSALAAPLLIVSQIIIQNAAVILFPGWVSTGGARARGIEAMGQRMLMLAGTLILLVVGVVPAALLAGLVGFLVYQVAGFLALLPAGLLFVAVLATEGAFFIALLGRVLERTDPSEVEVAE